MPSIERLQSATEKHAEQRHSILATLLRALFGLWADFDRVDDQIAVKGMAARSATLVHSAIAQTKRAERTYNSTVFREIGIAVPDLPVVDDYYPRANVEPVETYSRPVEQWIWVRRNGGTMEEARAALEQRLTDIAESDVWLASRDESDQIYDRSTEVIGYRRIIHPELSRSGSCGLCVVASAQFYKSEELLPLHGGSCNCTKLPITRESDPGLRINQDDLKRIYAAAGSTAGDDLVNTRVTITEHGELGPILVKQGDHFKTAEEAGRPPYVKPTPDSIRAKIATALEDNRAALELGQARYEQLVADHPESLEPNTSSQFQGERIALFRSLKYLREYISSSEARLRTLDPK